MTSKDTAKRINASDECCLCGTKLGAVKVNLTKPDKYERAAGISEKGYVREWRECPRCGALCDIHLSPEDFKLDNWQTNYYEIEESAETLTQKFHRVMALPPEKSDNRQRVERVHCFMLDWARVNGNPPAREQKVVDVGSGMGVFLKGFLERKGWRGLAIEPSSGACEHLRKVGGFEVIEGLFSPELGLSGVDLMTFNKVVEHIRLPSDVIRAAAAAAAPAGIIYVEVPHRLCAESYPAEHPMLGALHHHLYSLGSLCNLLESCGWAPLQSGTVYDPSGKISAYAFGCLKEFAVNRGRQP